MLDHDKSSLIDLELQTWTTRAKRIKKETLYYV